MVKIHIRLFILTGMLASIWWGFHVMAPPAVKQEDAAADEFSAQRAFRHVQHIAQRPYPVGTDEHANVHRYLLKQLRNLGLSPQTDTLTAIRASGLTAASISNIQAKLEGSQSGRTIVLMAHYDSAFYSKGAADDAAGVAAILEVIRAMQAGGQPKHDVLVLFTDGEELGLLGANHFIKTYPQRDNIELVINLEARGTSGRSFMFETNRKNNNLISLFAQSGGHPAANSLTYSIYKKLPNSTDFSVIKPYGIQGLNYAFIDNLINYHTLQDSPENLSLRSLQHQGEQVLSSVRQMANTASTVKINGEHDAIYFNGPFSNIWYYPAKISPFLTLLAGLLLMISFVKVRHTTDGRWTIKGISAILLWITIALIGAGIGHYVFAKWVYQVNNQGLWLQQGALYTSGWNFWGFLSLNILLVSIVLDWLVKKYSLKQTMLGLYTAVLFICIVLVVFVRGAHYVLIWPLLCSLAGFLVTVSRWKINSGVSSGKVLLLLVSLAPSFFFIAPYIKFLHIALTTRSIFVAMALATILQWLAWPLLSVLKKEKEPFFYSTIAAALLICFLGGYFQSDFTKEQRKQNSLMYHYDATQNRAFWLSKDKMTDEWTRRYLGAEPADTTLTDYMFFGNTRLLMKPADNLPIKPKPDVKILSDHVSEDVRTVRLFVRASNQLRAIISRVSLKNNNRLLEISVDGQKVFDRINPLPNQAKGFDRLLVFKDHREGFQLSMSIQNPELTLHIQSTFYSLSFPDGFIRNREENMMPKPFGFTNGISWRHMTKLEMD